MSEPYCVVYREYMEAQIARLRRAIDENKWYLSERAGRDVGLAAAKADFWERHGERWAREFRLAYCGGECRRREECPLAPDRG